METETMGRVLTEVTIENLQDLWAAERGLIPADQVRRIVVPDALVDTGAALLSMPASMIRQLGLTERYKKRAVDSRGVVGDLTVYGTVQLTIQGRTCPTDAVEVPDNVPVLIGQIPLEYVDLVVDPRNQRLIGNPAHGGEHILEMY